ncbi:MAG: PAS domain S-box protein [Anaerolineales bacterium]
MASTRKTKKELVQQIDELRRRVDELEALRAAGKPDSIEVHQILESMFDRTHMLVVHLNLDFDIIRVSRAFADAAGRDPAYFRGKNFFALYPSTENKTFFHRVLAFKEVVFESAKVFRFNMDPQGKQCICDWTMIPIMGMDQEATGLLLTLRDRTEWVKREQEYKTLVNGMNDTAFVIDFDGKFLEMNDAAIEVLGYSREELLSMGPNDIDAQLDMSEITHLIEGIKMGETQVFETKHVTKEGKTFPVEVSSSLVTYGGEPAILSITRDLTERKKTELRLALTHAGIDHAQIGMFQVDDDGRIYYVNQYACDNLGYSRDELLSMRIWEIDSNLDEQRWREHRTTTHAQGITIMETVHRRKDGSEFPVEVTINFATIDDKQVSISVSRDITERKVAEKQREMLLDQLREHAQRLLDVMSTVPVGLLLLDSAHKVILANPIGEEALEVLANAQVGSKLTHLGNRMLQDLISTPLKTGLRHEVTAKGRVFEVTTQSMSDEQKTGNFLLVVEDVTLERQVQRELHQQERLATVGQMAAGLAHDFNNIMSIIALYARQHLRDPDLPVGYREHLEIITQQTDRARDLIQQILDFGRRAILERRPIDLAKVLQEQIRLLQRMLPETVRIEFESGDDEYTVNADPTRMQQILLNLALNARDAMPMGGLLQVELNHLRVDKKVAAKMPELPSGDWVRLTVTDDGSGISADVMPHIFNPFFSTKAPGKGSGLGLAQVYGIVKQHGGYITVDSLPGKGTTFDIFLPAESEKPADHPAVDVRASYRGHGETILVVEDNEALLKALVEILSSLDYRVLGASNGRKALEILAKNEQEVDLVLSDLVMPEMGGKELLRRIQQQGLAVPTVMMTGHPREDELLDLEAEGLSGWLRKPPTVEQIGRLLARVLQNASD